MDTIGNLLTSIRNAEMAGLSQIVVPHAGISEHVLAILKDNGFIKAFETITVEKFKKIKIDTLAPKRHFYKRVSKLGRRVYVKKAEIPMIRRGRGIVILSTPSGIMSGKEANKQGVGGELMCIAY